MTVPDIAIVGGGPCGLTLARLLECKGINYAVYERDESESSNRTGGSLDIHPETGQHALKEGGLFDEFRKFARYDDTLFTLADMRGNQIFRTGQQRDAPEIDRVQLRQILLDAIPKDKVKWGHRLASATFDANHKPVLRFENGVELSGFKLVVGTDGAWSKIRSLVTQAVPKYSGKSYIETKIGHDNPLFEKLSRSAGPGMYLSIGPNRVIVTQRQGDGHYRTYFGIQPSESRFRSGVIDPDRVETVRTELLSEFADWSDEYKDLIHQSTDFRAWKLYTLSTEDVNWRSIPGVTLAGDAAHLAIPNGEGVNLAMTDSFQLMSKIVEHGLENVDKAVQEYEKEMFQRGVATIIDGIKMGDGMYGGDPQKFLDGIGGDGGDQ